jgi:hypothetical protein
MPGELQLALLFMRVELKPDPQYSDYGFMQGELQLARLFVRVELKLDLL